MTYPWQVSMAAGAAAVALSLAGAPATAAPNAPSRAAMQGCAWEKLSDPGLGLEAWVQRCDLGFRKVDFFVQDASLMVRYSDGGDPDPVVDVLELQAGEAPEDGLRRLFAARTDRGLVRRCVLAPYQEKDAPAGVKRFAFVPDAAYRKQLDAEASPDEVPEPPCGEWGTTPDGIQYFEVQPQSGARKVLFVRLGQDEPLFDEKTLRLLPPRP
jgi:hypothetical protein